MAGRTVRPIRTEEATRAVLFKFSRSAKQDAESRPADAGRRILIVDDMRHNVELLKRWLAPEGYAIFTAANGREAMAEAAQHKPDLVLLDIMLPPPSGFEVCEQIKKDPETRHAAVILMTGLQHPENRLRGLEVGADDFLQKPFDAHDVRMRVRLALLRKQTTRVRAAG